MGLKANIHRAAKLSGIIVRPSLFYAFCLVILVYTVNEAYYRLTPSSHMYTQKLIPLESDCLKKIDSSANESAPSQLPYFRLVTPKNYQNNRKHPLMLVFAPANLSPLLSEIHSGLTPGATKNGFILAYVSSVQMSKAKLASMEGITEHISQQWCIDEDKVVATGHSNGGTITLASTLIYDTGKDFKAIATSNAGWHRDDYKKLPCPDPRPVMIAHSKNDSVFPEFGEGSVEWWASCNGCDMQKKAMPSGCWAYSGCIEATQYCESEKRHWQWAVAAESVIDFLTSAIQ